MTDSIKITVSSYPDPLYVVEDDSRPLFSLESADVADSVAIAICGAVRGRPGIALEPVVLFPADQAAFLVEAVKEETETSLAAFNDDPWPEGIELGTLESISQREDGVLALDYGQASLLGEMLWVQLETYEDDPALDDAEKHIASLRAAGRHLVQAGVLVDRTFGDNYRMQFTTEGLPYAVAYENQALGTASHIAEADKLIRQHRGPAVGSQLSIEDQ